MTVFVLALAVASCQKAPAPTAPKLRGLTAVATIFPAYDFARTIGGGRASVLMLVPPGVETHEYEPRPDDFVRVHGADFFIYTGPSMEPWAGTIVAGVDPQKTEVINLGPAARPQGGSPGLRATSDPHIWLDFFVAAKMADLVAEGFSRRDPSNREFYVKNAGGLKNALSALDARYASRLKNCKRDVFIHGGHRSFDRLARRYGLRYEAAVDSFRDAEPLPARMAELARLMRDTGIKYVLYDELEGAATASALANENGAELLAVNSAHTVSKGDFKNGATFASIMEKNLERLERALECKS
ncbi:MAG: zinc ABC transporter substrate-binding protein [Nitrospinae bacterium]|nr:zinc ABC transporter substrate-binding protein [Nitrospinota bacterium]